MADNSKSSITDILASIGKKVLGGGKAGAAANDLASRKDKLDAAINAATGDGTQDPTSVNYGGQPGQADRTPYNK